MRPTIDLRAGCALAAGVTCAVTAAAILAPGPARPCRSQLRTATATVRLVYGQRFVVAGDPWGAGRAGGARLVLQYERRGASSWQALARGRAARRGSYRLRGRLTESGALRIAVLPADRHTSGSREHQPSSSGPSAAAAGRVPRNASPQLPVSVRAGVTATPAQVGVLAGHRAVVGGRLLPARPAARVSLQMNTRHGWVTVAHAHTGGGGRFHIGYAPRHLGSALVRVRFTGDARNAPAEGRPARLNSYRVAVASWYGAGGVTACGEQLTDATLGVANKTLPCGTLVTLRYHGRTVRVPVIDRGPFVPGRDFDLTPATKAALGFPDLDALWATA